MTDLTSADSSPLAINPADSCAGQTDGSQPGSVGSCCEEHHPETPIDRADHDGAGEPCPPPLMWQDIHQNYLQQSTPWEVVCGSHHVFGRTWGEGRPLYFLNNFVAAAELFSLTAWLLRDQFKCVLFDTTVSGHGGSGRPTMTEYGDDLFAVADAQNDQTFSVYGAAFGAAVGLQAALSQPGRIERMLLQHGFASRRLSFFERCLANVCLRSSALLDRLPQRKRFQAVNHQPWFPPFDQTRFQFLVESTGRLPVRDLARRALAVHSFDVSQRLGEITCPVVLLRTEGEGRVAAETQAVLEQRLPNCRVEWMHSAGQHPYLTHPHRVAKLIQSIFEQ
jgi:pimeloyl-ACP methyl ester carboxylesterase